MRRFALGSIILALFAPAVLAGPKEDLAKVWTKGADALVKLQLADGGWVMKAMGETSDVAMTGMALQALAGTEEGKKKYAEAIAKGCDYLLKNQDKDGAIHNASSVPRLSNYKTAIAVMALAAADKVKHKDAIAKGVTWLTGHQYSEDAAGDFKVDAKDGKNGGAGYGENPGKEGPAADLSNTSYMLEALNAAEIPKDSDVYKRALKYIAHCQNRSESNDGPGFDKLGLVVGDDGGFFYRVGESKAEKETLPNGKVALRSYGSMTYSGYKSFIFAGLGKDDPKVKAAMGWIEKHYTLDENPNMGQKGLYYYYNVFATALDISGMDEIKDADGETHRWAEELVAKLATLQKADGTWAGDPKWWEDMDPLPTLYSMIALGKASRHLK
ncbi:MAG: cycloartenol synthase-like [Planctomycetota bacterium]|nr:MAG: cycloartenol synthase-like [Planctomycetota bacterium]